MYILYTQIGPYKDISKKVVRVTTMSTFAVEDVYTELVIDVFYIFNSTVID